MQSRLLTILICIFLYGNARRIVAQEKTTPVAPATQPTPVAEKPASPAPGSDTAVNPPKPAETKPAIAPANPTETAKPPVAPEARPPLTEDELRVQKEAEIRAQKEREAAAEKARADEARRIEEAKTFFDKLLENSKMYTGLHGGLGFGLNSTHKTGYGFGMTVDYLAYRRYGFHFAAETGILPTKTQSLNATPSPISVAEGGTFGYLGLSFAAVYALPVFAGFESALGAGISVYQLRGGTYDFNQTVAPMGYASIYYSLLSHLQVGILTSLVASTASKVTSASSEYKLDASLAQTAVGLHLSVRYSWF